MLRPLTNFNHRIEEVNNKLTIKLNNLEAKCNNWFLQAVVLPHPDYGVPTSSCLKSIAIPISYSEILLRYNYTIISQMHAEVKLMKLNTLTLNSKLGAELYIVYEGKDNDFYYFHTEVDRQWQDNSMFIYAR